MITPAPLCGETYQRLSVILHCHYLKGHPKEQHSWFAVQCQDESDMADAAAKKAAREATFNSDCPTEISHALTRIAEGSWDEWLEKVLAVGHDRKRARRGVKGFTNQAGER